MPPTPLVATVLDTVLALFRSIDGGSSWHNDLSGDDSVVLGDSVDLLQGRDLMVIVAPDPLVVEGENAAALGGWLYRLTLRVIGRAPAEADTASARWSAAAKLQRDLTRAINIDPGLGLSSSYGLKAEASIDAYGGIVTIGGDAVGASVSGKIVVEWHEMEAP